MHQHPPQLSIIVPTFREVDNIALLTQQVFSVTSAADIAAELILVDDNSQDGSVALVDSL